MKVRRINWSADEWLAGTATLKADERGVYDTIINLIYSHGGPIPDDEKDLARLCGCHWRSFRRIRETLVSRGKIVAENGQVMVRRCAKELQDAFRRTAEASQNARKGRRKSGNFNGLAKPDAFRAEKLTTITNHEPLTVEEDSEANASDVAAAPSVPESDPVKAFWTKAVGHLVATGVSDKQARPIVGKWRREFGDAAVMAAVAESERETATEPIAFISACLQKSRTARNGANGHGRKLSRTQEHSLAGLQAIWDADREEDLHSTSRVTWGDTS